MTISANTQGTQFTVDTETYTLRQTIAGGIKFLEAIKWDGEEGVFISTNAEEIKPLFIALHNWKVENGYK